MKKTGISLAKEWRRRRSDQTESITDTFVKDAINWAFRELCRYPGVGSELFKYHTTVSLGSNSKTGGKSYRWNLHDPSRTGKIIKINMLNLYKNAGGEPQLLTLNFSDPDKFFTCNPMITVPKAGMPTEMTVDDADDSHFLVLNRPSLVPLILTYRFAAYPKELKKITDEMMIPTEAYNTILDFLDIIYFQESMDYALTDPTWSNIDKAVSEIRQRINSKVYGTPYILR